MAAWEKRFEAKVDRTGDCHMWTGAKTKSGVGQLRVDGKLRTAAQLAGNSSTESSLPEAEFTLRQEQLCVRVDDLDINMANAQPGDTRHYGGPNVATDP